MIFMRYHNGIVAVKKAVSVLRKCRLKYLGVKYCDICSLFSNGSAKGYIFKYSEKANVTPC